MFDFHQESTETQSAAMVVVLAIAFILSPAVLIAPRPLVAILLAFSCSAMFAAIAGVNWKKYALHTIPSSRPRTKS